jgi:hypothetical protein
MDLVIPIVFPSAHFDFAQRKPLREHPFNDFLEIPSIGVGERSRTPPLIDFYDSPRVQRRSRSTSLRERPVNDFLEIPSIGVGERSRTPPPIEFNDLYIDCLRQHAITNTIFQPILSNNINF